MNDLPLLGPAEIRELAEMLGIRPTKTLGQNFVIDPNTIRRIVNAAEISPEETVLEVGPGLGSLTLGILDAAKDMVAVEIDPPLAQQLPHTIEKFRPEKAGDIDVVLIDALKVTELPRTPMLWWQTCPITWRFRCFCTCLRSSRASVTPW